MADVTKRIDVEVVSKGFDKLLTDMQVLDKTAAELGDKLVQTGVITRKQADDMSKGFAKVVSPIRAAKDATDQLAASGTKNATVVKRQADSVQDLAKKYETATDQYKSWANTQRDFGGQQSTTLNVQKNLNATIGQGIDMRQGLANATQKMTQATGGAASSLPRLRYALYDVSSTLAIAGTAMLGLATATVGTAIKMDREFADVLRTTEAYMDSTGRASRELRDDFNELFSTLPGSWADLTEIGTLAGQLGVARRDVAEFTRLVTMFAATTDVSVEQSATAFGRLSALLDVPASKFENLGSSILAVGVSSVSTESQIINTSSQIASIGNFAGFSADEVIGLSSALASLGVQPELSRGTITRTFTRITDAIAQGGARLEAFGRLAGMTGKQFAVAWEKDAAGALQAFLSGLGRIEGSGAIAQLRELGITAARDVPTLLRLAQNMDLVSDQFEIAAKGFEDGTALQEHYGVVAETTAAKLQVLAQNVQLLVGALGDQATGPISFFADMLTKALQVMTAIVENPVLAWISAVGIAIVGLTGVLSVLLGGAARAGASVLALRTAMLESSRAAAALTGTAATAAGAVNGLGAAAARAQVSFAALARVLGPVAAALAAVYAAGKGVQYLNNKIQGATASADDFAESLSSVSDSADSLNSLDDLFSSGPGWLQGNMFSTAIGGTEDAIARLTDPRWIHRLEDISSAIGKVNLVAGLTQPDSTKSRVEEEFQALGEYLGELVRSGDLEKATGIFDELSQAWIESGGTLEELKELMPEFTSAIADVGAQTVDTSGAFGEFEGQALDASEAIKVLTDEIDFMFEALNTESNLFDALDNLGESLRKNGADISTVTEEGRANLAALEAAFAAAAEYAAGDADLFAQATEGIMQAMVSSGQVSAETLAYLADMGVRFGQGLSTEASRARAEVVAMLQVARGVSSVFAGKEGLFGMGGKFVTRNLDSVISYINAVKDPAPAKNVALTNSLVDQLARGWDRADQAARNAGKKQSKAAKDAAKEVRTLSDYVSDLGSVMSAAFDFQFGFQAAKDDSLSAFRAIQDSFEDARKKAQDLRLEIRDLKADMQLKEADIGRLNYQLSIALMYSDTHSEEQIRADLAKATSDLAKQESDLTGKQKDLNKAIADGIPDVTSNTEAAIEQRSAVTDLIGQYQKQIEQYAATGASQKEVEDYSKQLTTQFETQMRQLGYNRDETEKYSQGLKDFTEVIKAVPRDLTVEVTPNTSAAEKAIKEFTEKKRSATLGVNTPSASTMNSRGKTAADNFKKGFGTPQIPKPKPVSVQIKFQMPSYSQMMKMQEHIRKITNNPSFRIALPGGQGGQTFASGGYTGPGGKYEPAGVVHRGEYVIPKHQVNQATGLPYADAFQRLSRGIASPTPSYANGGFTGPAYPSSVDLSPMSVQQIARAVQPYLVVDGRVVGEITSNQYAQGTRVGAN